MATFKAAAAGESEQQWRQYLSYLHQQTSTGLATAGVVSGLVVAQTTSASASVTVSAGLAVSQDAALSGVSPLVNTASATLDVLTANPMGATPRNDIVVFDESTAGFLVVVGTPNAVPTDPATSATQVPLARLRHAASATTVPTAKIDDLRTIVGRYRADTGWVNITILGSYAANSGETPQLRMIDGQVQLRGAWSSTSVTAGASHLVGRIAQAAHRPPVNVIIAIGSSTGEATASMVISASTGDMNLRTSATLGAYYSIGGASYRVD